jgi:preprotein translocase subunit SecE
MAETTDNTTPQTAGAANVALTALSAILVLGGFVAFYALSTRAPWVRWAALVAGLAVGIGVFATTSYGRLVWQYVDGSRVELRKMVWPTKEETWRTTLVVFMFVALLGLFFWVVDFFLGWGTRHLLGGGT